MNYDLFVLILCLSLLWLFADLFCIFCPFLSAVCGSVVILHLSLCPLVSVDFSECSSVLHLCLFVLVLHILVDILCC